VVFIDDNRANVEAAAKLGLHAIHFIDANSLRRELVGLGLLKERA
jgi:2-haloacid dehalogenase